MALKVWLSCVEGGVKVNLLGDGKSPRFGHLNPYFQSYIYIYHINNILSSMIDSPFWLLKPFSFIPLISWGTSFVD